MGIDIDKSDLNSFLDSVDGFFDLKAADQIDYFVYYITVEKGQPVTQATAIRECFLKSDLSPYSNISSYLINNVRGKEKNGPKFLRIKDGYQLHRSLRNHSN